jgi:hypothetical protein
VFYATLDQWTDQRQAANTCVDFCSTQQWCVKKDNELPLLQFLTRRHAKTAMSNFLIMLLLFFFFTQTLTSGQQPLTNKKDNISFATYELID